MVGSGTPTHHRQRQYLWNEQSLRREMSYYYCTVRLDPVIGLWLVIAIREMCRTHGVEPLLIPNLTGRQRG